MKLTKEMLRMSGVSTLEMIIADSEKRIASNPQSKEYVKGQRELIKNCEEVIKEKTGDQ